MINKALLLLAVSLVLVLAACGQAAPQPAGETDPGEQHYPTVQPLPEEWLNYPGARPVDYLASSYEVDWRNAKVYTQGWILLAPEDVHPDQQPWQKILQYYDALAAERDDFEKDERAGGGNYLWGRYKIMLDGDTDPEDSSRYNIWFSMSYEEPIDPDQPVK
jgi:hypothetical protein